MPQLPTFLPGRFTIRRGRRADYQTLAPFHYLPKRPATFAAIAAIDYAERPAGGCMRQDCLEPRASVRWSCVSHTPGIVKTSGLKSAAEDRAPEMDRDGGATCMSPLRIGPTPLGRTIAVGVLSWPVPSCGARDRHFGLLGQSRRDKIVWANANLRTISRVIVHPQFRSLSLSTILVDWLCEHCDTRYIESMAKMGNAHPFFERAGLPKGIIRPATAGSLCPIVASSPPLPKSRSESPMEQSPMALCDMRPLRWPTTP